MAIDWKQYNYPDFPFAGETIAVAGCGACACADLLEVDPRETATWLDNNGWTVSGQGTIYEGIAACLTAFHADGVMIARDQDYQMDNDRFDFWCVAIQSGFEGILLMHACKSTYWTRGGHYIAIVGYDDGKYLVYDPASAERTGWHPFSDFAGDISALYISSKRWKEANYMFTVKEIKKGDTGKDVYLAQALLRGRGYREQINKKPIMVDSSFGDLTESAVIWFQHKNHLPETGVVDVERTWPALLRR